MVDESKNDQANVEAPTAAEPSGAVTQIPAGEPPAPEEGIPGEAPPGEAIAPPAEAEPAAPPRSRRWLWVGIAVLLLIAAGGGGWWAWTSGPLKGWRAVASMDGQRITRTELDEYTAYLVKVGRLPGVVLTDTEKRAEIERAILDDLVNRRLLLAEIERRKIVLTPAEEQALQGKGAGAAPGTEKPAEAGKPPAQDDPQAREEVRRQLLVGRLAEQITENVAVSDDEVAKYYEDNRASFMVPGAAKLRLLVVATREEAEHLRQRVAGGGTDFAAVARDHSTGPAKEKGGDVGWVDVRMMPPAIGQAIAAIKETGMTPVVENGGKFYLLKVEGRQPARQVPLAELKEQLKPAMLLERRRAKFTEMLNELRKNAKVEVYL
jgi:parvulin-like peptidyl-prolyl isomerase